VFKVGSLAEIGMVDFFKALESLFLRGGNLVWLRFWAVENDGDFGCFEDHMHRFCSFMEVIYGRLFISVFDLQDLFILEFEGLQITEVEHEVFVLRTDALLLDVASVRHID